MVFEKELFDCPELASLDFFCEGGCRAKFTKEMWMHVTNCFLAFWMLLPA